jgi:hypothetical protein
MTFRSPCMMSLAGVPDLKSIGAGPSQGGNEKHSRRNRTLFHIMSDAVHAGRSSKALVCENDSHYHAIRVCDVFWTRVVVWCEYVSSSPLAFLRRRFDAARNPRGFFLSPRGSWMGATMPRQSRPFPPLTTFHHGSSISARQCRAKKTFLSKRPVKR